ncbi:MAG TPA: hypothetical protein VFO38_01340 [Candidatus Saccharimonadales bacterium]|nr:hypothetical protein [Candidatus Saccharimonadales bacterium]
MSTPIDESVSPEFAAHARDVLQKEGWTEEQIETGLAVAGRDVLPVFHLSRKIQDRRGSRSAPLVRKILAEATTLDEAMGRLRHLGMTSTIQESQVLPYLRGILVGLGVDHTMWSPLNDCDPQPPTPKERPLGRVTKLNY